MEAEYPDLHIQILGINERGHEQGNSIAVANRDLPLLQDYDLNQDGRSDIWASWNIEWRDLVFVNGLTERIGTVNLTNYDLANQDNYAAARSIFVGLAQNRPLWQNPTNALDVNDDGLITPIDDVLRLINEINNPRVRAADGRLPLPMPHSRPTPYYDVNGDGSLSAVADVLPIINFINESQGGGEGESATERNARAEASLQPTGLVIALGVVDSGAARSLLAPVGTWYPLQPGLVLRPVHQFHEDDLVTSALIVPLRCLQQLDTPQSHDERRAAFGRNQ